MHSHAGKLIEGKSADEPTTVVLRNIKDLLAENGQAHLLMSSKDTSLRQAAAAAADRAAIKHAPKPALQMPATPTRLKSSGSLSQRLARKLFG